MALNLHLQQRGTVASGPRQCGERGMQNADYCLEVKAKPQRLMY